MTTLNEVLPKSARPMPVSDLGPVVATQRGWEVVHDRNGYCELLVECPRLYDFLSEKGFDQFGKPLTETVNGSGEKETEQDPQPLTREGLMKMEFAQLKEMAVQNEITEKSREKIVNELCTLFGLE